MTSAPPLTRPKWLIVTQGNCSFCTKAKNLLAFTGCEYNEVVVTKENKNYWMKKTGMNTVPMIFDPHGKLVGGYSQLYDMIIYSEK